MNATLLSQYVQGHKKTFSETDRENLKRNSPNWTGIIRNKSIANGIAERKSNRYNKTPQSENCGVSNNLKTSNEINQFLSLL